MSDVSNTTEVKSGVKTTEFAVTILTTIASVLVLSGILKPEDATQFVELGSQIVAGVLALVVVVSYIRGRVNIKTEQLKLQTAVEMSKSKQLG